MPFEIGTGGATLDAFITNLESFATTNGWTADDFDTVTDNSLSLDNDDTTAPNPVFAQFEWDGLTDINMFQSLQHDGGTTVPGAHTNDSGNGDLADDERRIDGIGNGPFVSHFFVTDDATNPTYLHGTLEYEVGKFRHFSIGAIEKKGTWTGGAYVCAHVWDHTSAQTDNPAAANHSVLWDAAQTGQPVGGAGANLQSGTMHLEGFPNQPASGKYGIFWEGTGTPGNDGDANGRVSLLGGVRGGPYANAMGWIPSSPTNGFIPLIPIPLWYRNTTTTPDDLTLLGYAPGVRLVNIKNLTGATDYVVGSNTWRVYPLTRKAFNKDDVEESWNAGIAWLKVS